MHGKTPVSIACRSGKTDLIDLLDKDHLLPRNDDKRLETSIVNVRHLQLKQKTYSEKMNTLLLLGHKLTMAFITCYEAEHNTVHIMEIVK